jgi:glycosyltransferase involved in cell wall biosynthesis
LDDHLADIRFLFRETQRLDLANDASSSTLGKGVLVWIQVSHRDAEPMSSQDVLATLSRLESLDPGSVLVIEGIGLFAGAQAGSDLMDLLAALRSLSSAHRLLVLGTSVLYYPEVVEATVRDHTGRKGIDWSDERSRGAELEEMRARLRAKDRAMADVSAELEAVRRDRDSKEEFIRQLSNELPMMQTLTFVDAALRRYAGALLWPARWAVQMLMKLARRDLAPRLTHSQQYAPRPLPEPKDFEPPGKPARYPLISIVTPSFNQAEFVGQTINSVLQQSYTQLEYFVQDGGSVDGTPELLRSFGDRLTSWESRPDGGQANAVNLGMARTTGEIMGWLNSDDLLLPGSLEYIAEYFDSHPEVDVVYGNRILIDSKERDIGCWVLPPHDDEILRWADYVPQETLFWRRRIWEAVGGSLDEGFHFALDWDLLLRFLDSGAHIVRVPRFLGAFRIHDLQKNYTIGHVHSREVRNLIRRTHGREASQQEIHRHMKPFFRRHILCDRLFRMGLFRYGITVRPPGGRRVRQQPG